MSSAASGTEISRFRLRVGSRNADQSSGIVRQQTRTAPPSTSSRMRRASSRVRTSPINTSREKSYGVSPPCFFSRLSVYGLAASIALRADAGWSAAWL